MLKIQDLFGYNWFSRREFLKSMAEIPWETVSASCGASFDCIRDIFVHSLQAEHAWIRRLRGKSAKEIYDIPFAKFADLDAIQEYANTVEAETNEYLTTLNEETLGSIFEFRGRDGKIRRHNVEDVLMHVVEEEIHHRGELLCIYWQNGIRPPYISYTAYTSQG